MLLYRKLIFVTLFQVNLYVVSFAKFVDYFTPPVKNSLSPKNSLIEKYGYQGIQIYTAPTTTTTTTTTISAPTVFPYVKTTDTDSLIGQQNNTMDYYDNEGRGKGKIKIGKGKKWYKHVYPLIVGLATAKSIIIPLVLKAIIVISKSAFIMSSLSFLISILLAIKWILLSTQKATEKGTTVEVVHVPVQHKYAGFNHGWSDRESDKHQYIPISSTYENYYSENDKSAKEASPYI